METKKTILTVALFALIATLATPAQAKVIYVDDNAPAGGDGSSWTTAYTFLQDALVEAETVGAPAEIRIAQGVYTPDRSSASPGGTGSLLATFPLLDNVALRGGFAGIAAPDPNARDIGLYETILSADLAGDDISVLDPRDLLTEPTRADNACWLVTAGPCSRSAVLEGLTLSSCANPDMVRGGLGALSLSDRIGPCCPSIRNCTFAGNAGRAIFIEGAPEIVDCAFLQNVGTPGGAALKISESSASRPCDLVIRGCVFAGNCGPGRGGAVHAFSYAPIVIEDCTFTQNHAARGGAIDCYGETNIVNCRFIRNTAEEVGGAIYFSRPGVTVTSCTFANNTAPAGSALACLEPYVQVIPPPFATITNTILWDEENEIHVTEYTEVNVTYSNIRGGWPGEGNIDVDPCFVELGHWDPNGTPNDPEDDFWVEGDYHLKSQAGRWDPNSASWVEDDVTSPCIDAGDPNSPIGYEPFPNGGRINMGAYGGTAEASKSYFGQPTCETPIAGDINGDCKVDFKDLVILLNHWLQTGVTAEE